MCKLLHNMSSAERRVTIRDLALESGVSVATVSRALRDNPRQSAKTRKSIKALARLRGYKPDPGLSALAAYRSRVRPPAAYGKLAVLVDTDRPEERFPALLKLHVTGLRSRAREFGYDIDLFQIEPEPIKQKRLSRALYARGIRGVIFAPIKWLPTAFNWDHFSVVSLGENLTRLGFCNVTYDHDSCISATYKKLREHGYRDIGFSNIADSEFRNRHLHVASYFKCLYLDRVALDASRVFLYDENSTWTPVPWLKANRFDAVIVSHPEEFLRRLEGTRAALVVSTTAAKRSRPACTPLRA